MRKKSKEKIKKILNMQDGEILEYLHKLSPSELGNIIYVMKIQVDKVEEEKLKLYQGEGKTSLNFQREQSLFLEIQRVRMHLHNEKIKRTKTVTAIALIMAEN